ncbi:MAG: efflux RND transporter periplasmic adaptor subunit [Nitrosomonas sp.]|nr:MAG: efflux RND transporter periplasmic adaptor subunit [Nitrosomonas sp.]
MNPIVKLSLAAAVAAMLLYTGYRWGSAQSQKTVNGDAAQSQQARKILYYRNPMGLPDTSPVPKKDPMGMDYLPVYQGEEDISANPGWVKISLDKVQKLGVRTETAAMRELMRTVRAVATVQTDERKQFAVVTKFEGWIQRLRVNTTGQTVKKGDALMDVYSPDLITAQQEYLIAMRGLQSTAGGTAEVRLAMRRLEESALQRLRNMDIAEPEIRRLQREGEAQQYMTLRAKADGVVLEKQAVEGQRFMPGDTLYRIADLANVWMLADVFEQDLGMIHSGQLATVRVDAYPGKVFNGEVAFIYPAITPETRTAIVRIILPNPDKLLKPAMYARVEFASSHSKGKVLTVPDSAVLDTGTRRVVLVERGTGLFEPRTVKLGFHADGYAEVLGGLQPGEAVVVKANFLIDAESNFKSAVSGFGHSSHEAIAHEQDVTAEPAGKSARITHHSTGTIEAMDFAHGVVTLTHAPIPSLKWPAMTMDFRAHEPTLLHAFKPGQAIMFEIAEEAAGEFVLVRIEAAEVHHDHREH